MLCDRKIPVKLKGKVYKIIIRSAILYAAETWTTKEIDEETRGTRDENVEMDKWKNQETKWCINGDKHQKHNH